LQLILVFIGFYYPDWTSPAHHSRLYKGNYKPNICRICGSRYEKFEIDTVLFNKLVCHLMIGEKKESNETQRRCHLYSLQLEGWLVSLF